MSTQHPILKDFGYERVNIELDERSSKFDLNYQDMNTEHHTICDGMTGEQVLSMALQMIKVVSYSYPDQDLCAMTAKILTGHSDHDWLSDQLKFVAIGADK